MRLQQAVLLNSIKEKCNILEVEGCCSSVVRALVAKASGPGFKSPATTKIFSNFSFAFFQTPLGEKVFNLKYFSIKELGKLELKIYSLIMHVLLWCPL